MYNKSVESARVETFWWVDAGDVDPDPEGKKKAENAPKKSENTKKKTNFKLTITPVPYI